MQVALLGTLVAMASRMLRLLGVLTVVAGVFAMHGLTSHHDTTMAMPAPAMTHAGPPPSYAAPAVPHAAPAVPQVAPAGEAHDMAGACMAVLTGLLLLLALLLGLRSLLVWRVVRQLTAITHRVLGERPPPRVAFSSLGVLRI